MGAHDRVAPPAAPNTLTFDRMQKVWWKPEEEVKKKQNSLHVS